MAPTSNFETSQLKLQDDVGNTFFPTNGSGSKPSRDKLELRGPGHGTGGNGGACILRMVR